MKWQAALLKSDQRILLKTFEQSDDSHKGHTKWLEVNEIQKICPTAFFYQDDLIENSEVSDMLGPQARFFPIRKASEFNLNVEQFEGLTFKELRPGMTSLTTKWTLNNNLSLLEELIPVVQHLKELWPNDRTAFFEEIWFLIKTNLHAHDLKLIFNDITSDHKDRPELTHVMIQGDRSPAPIEGGEVAQALIKHYENEFHSPFHLAEYLPEQGQFVFACQIKKSPVLVIGQAAELTRLQLALLKSLFQAVQ